MSTLSKGTPILSFIAMKSGKEWEAKEGRKYLLVEEEGSGYNLYLMPIEEQERRKGKERNQRKGITPLRYSYHLYLLYMKLLISFIPRLPDFLP